jgi:hypothetical protein
MSLLYKLYYTNIVFTDKTILTPSSSNSGKLQPHRQSTGATLASRRSLHHKSPSHLHLLSGVTARVSRLMIVTQQVKGKT